MYAINVAVLSVLAIAGRMRMVSDSSRKQVKRAC